MYTNIIPIINHYNLNSSYICLANDIVESEKNITRIIDNIHKLEKAHKCLQKIYIDIQNEQTLTKKSLNETIDIYQSNYELFEDKINKNNKLYDEINEMYLKYKKQNFYKLEYLHNNIKYPLKFMTYFTKIYRSPFIRNNKLHFCFDLTELNYDNHNFIVCIHKIMDFVKSNMSDICDNIKMPYVEKDGKKLLYVTLSTFKNQITTSLIIHKSKKHGGGTIAIKNKSCNETLKFIKNNISINKYYKKQDKQSDIWPVGKCCIIPYLDISRSIIDDKLTSYCKLIFYVKEMELKYNVSKINVSKIDLIQTNHTYQIIDKHSKFIFEI